MQRKPVFHSLTPTLFSPLFSELQTQATTILTPKEVRMPFETLIYEPLGDHVVRLEAVAGPRRAELRAGGRLAGRLTEDDGVGDFL